MCQKKRLSSRQKKEKLAEEEKLLKRNTSLLKKCLDKIPGYDKANCLYGETESLFHILSVYFIDSPQNYKVIRYFDGFHTYFTGFNENRKNVYDIKGEGKDQAWHFLSTSIAHRLFEQNLQFHFGNIKAWDTIQESLKNESNQKKWKENSWNWEEELNRIEKALNFSLKDLLTVGGFYKYFSQAGMDRYNEILGGRPEEEGKEKQQGLNELINLTRQKSNNPKGKHFPSLQLFYKQILSDKEKVFSLIYETDEQMLNEIKDFADKEKSIFKSIENNPNEIEPFQDFFNSNEDHKNNIFLSTENIRFISNEIGGRWNAMTNWYLDTLQNDSEKQKASKKKVFTIEELEESFKETFEGKDFYDTYIKDRDEWKEKIKKDNIFLSYFSKHLEESLSKSKASRCEFKKQVTLDAKKKLSVNQSGANGRDHAKEIIKAYLDDALNVFRFFKSLNIKDKDFDKEKEQDDHWKNQVNRWLGLYENSSPRIINLYNKTRNYLTKKPYSTEKYKLNFENATLGDGWDKNKESDNTALLFEKDGLFYLGIMNKKDNQIFAFTKKSEIEASIQKNRNEISTKEKKKQDKTSIQKISELKEEIEDLQLIFSAGGKPVYQKMNYKLLPGANKMLPKVFFASSNQGIFQLSDEIKKIKDEKLFTKEEIEKHGIANLHKYIDFCKKSLNNEKYEKEWYKYDFKFQDTKEYESIDQFYREVEEQGYKIDFQDIPEAYIHRKMERDQLHLFQIYNKDFSPHSKGRENLHTTYWRLLFDPENLKDVVLKLNGEAELFYRKISIEKPYKHEVGSVLKHKRHAKIWKTLESPIGEKLTQSDLERYEKFAQLQIKGDRHNKIFFEKEEIGRIIKKNDVEIIKDRRFSEDKFFFHCPITLNFKAKGNQYLNNRVNEFLGKSNDIKIIGIDRGEKHLLYYSLIDSQGEVIKQGSLNAIVSQYQKDGKNIEGKTEYQKMLHEKEGERAQARENWENIENIKELKAGYLSQVVHQLSKLIIENNAIVVLEDLNKGFKRGRFAVEKQVYQKFEKALIDKLNYLVFKDKETGEAGHYLKAYQLTNKFESFQKLGKQSGILFYVTASYTSRVDPVTGYMQNLYPKQKEGKAIGEFFKKFESIQYEWGLFCIHL